MTKTSSLTLAAAAFLTMAGLAAPALADDRSDTPFNDDAVLATLHEQGINASNLQEWNGKIRATVTLADGSSTFEYFDAVTLKPVDPGVGNGTNTRVLSRLDVGDDAGAPATDLRSLTWVDPDTQYAD